MRESATNTTRTCKACNHQFEGNFCNQCGEKAITPHDKTLLHLFEEGFHFITHFEGKFFTSLKALLTAPGKLSLDYCNGIRKKYFKPLSFFLMLVIVYLLFPLFDGLNVTLQTHTNQWSGAYALATTQKKMVELGITDSQMIEKFRLVSKTVSKFVLLLMIPLLALWSQLLTLKRKDKLFYDHFIFSTEIMSVLVLWGFLLLPLPVLLYIQIKTWLTGAANVQDGFIGLLLMTLLFTYAFIAARRFFALRRHWAALYALTYIGVCVFLFLTLYRFLVFFISIRQVH